MRVDFGERIHCRWEKFRCWVEIYYDGNAATSKVTNAAQFWIRKSRKRHLVYDQEDVCCTNEGIVSNESHHNYWQSKPMTVRLWSIPLPKSVRCKNICCGFLTKVGLSRLIYLDWYVTHEALTHDTWHETVLKAANWIEKRISTSQLHFTNTNQYTWPNLLVFS